VFSWVSLKRGIREGFFVFLVVYPVVVALVKGFVFIADLALGYAAHEGMSAMTLLAGGCAALCGLVGMYVIAALSYYGVPCVLQGETMGESIIKGFRLAGTGWFQGAASFVLSLYGYTRLYQYAQWIEASALHQSWLVHFLYSGFCTGMIFAFLWCSSAFILQGHEDLLRDRARRA
jgi:hypothetical protein